MPFLTARILADPFCIRSWTTDQANKFNITGFVKNTNEGTVTGEAQGDESSLDKFKQHLNMGPGPAKVSKVDVKEIATKDGESSFEQ